jgi:hypothetical protein
MKTLRNNKGFALPFVLILAAIALTITVAMFVMLGRGSFVSGQQKRYRTAAEASRGGMEAMMQLIASGGNTAPYSTLGIALPNAAGLVNMKLVGPVLPATLPTGPWPGWGGLDNAITIDPNDSTTYDMRIDLGDYRVFAKVVDTVQGNSAVGESLLKSGVVATGTGEVVAVSVPYLYTIEVLSQSRVNPTERSKLSALYQY